jgi:hypothetical protein
MNTEQLLTRAMIGSRRFRRSNVVVPPDTEDPSVPGNWTADIIDTTSVQCSHDESTDNVGVTQYNYYKDDVLDGTTLTPDYLDLGESLTYTFTGLSPSTAYNFDVEAEDGAGNKSAKTRVSPTTSASGQPPGSTLIDAAWRTANGPAPYYLDGNTYYWMEDSFSEDGIVFVIKNNGTTLDGNNQTITYDNEAPVSIPNFDFSSGDFTSWDTVGAGLSVLTGNEVGSPATVCTGDTHSVQVDTTATTTQTITTTANVTGIGTGQYVIYYWSNDTTQTYSNYQHKVEYLGTSLVAQMPGGLSQNKRGTVRVGYANFSVAPTPNKVRITVTDQGGATTTNLRIGHIVIAKMGRAAVVAGPDSTVVQTNTYNRTPNITHNNGAGANAIIKNLVINQGQGKSFNSHQISLLGAKFPGGGVVDNCSGTVTGDSCISILGQWSKNWEIKNCNFTSNSLLIRNRELRDGFMLFFDKADGANIHDNTLTKGCQGGIVVSREFPSSSAINCNSNTINTRSHYTNGFGIQAGRLNGGTINSNTINQWNNDDPDRGGRGMHLDSAQGIEIASNTITCRELQKNQEYSAGLVTNGTYGIQLEQSCFNLDIHDNTVTCHGSPGGAWPLRINRQRAVPCVSIPNPFID